MSPCKKYIFTSERLGFRNWLASDLAPMAELNADPEVMEFFPKTLIEIETQAFIGRMQAHFSEKGFCYFAVETLENAEFIGFIGLSVPAYEADFMPCVDIGWRLKRSAWNKGYATEGAKRCLVFAFEELKLQSVKAMAPVANVRSEEVMKRIGMTKVKHFNHPLLAGNERLQECVLYEIDSAKQEKC